MPKLLRCPQGHRWDPLYDRLPAADGQVVCPSCGGVLRARLTSERLQVAGKHLRKYEAYAAIQRLYKREDASILFGTLVLGVLTFAFFIAGTVSQGPTVSSVTFAPDGQSLAFTRARGEGRQVRGVVLWDLTREQRRSERDAPGTMRALAFSGDGRWLVLAGGDSPDRDQKVHGTVTVWDNATGRERTDRSVAGGLAVGVGFTPDAGEVVVADGEGLVIIRGLADGRGRTAFRCRGRLCSMAVSPDGRTLAAGGADGTVELWDLATARTLNTLPTPGAALACLAFAPDGRTLAGASGLDRAVRLWDANTGRALASWDVPLDWVNGVAFAPDGRTLAAGGGCLKQRGAVLLYDVTTGEVKATFTARTRSVLCAAISPDGRTLAAGNAHALSLFAGGDGEVQRWDLATGQELPPLK